jgi:hypothetical protein
MLVGLEKDAILFTNGDNDTFPLWYIQTVEHFRPDVPCRLSFPVEYRLVYSADPG